MEKMHFKDLSDFVDCLTNEKIKNCIVDRFVKRRKECKITQKELSKRSGVSCGTIRRFEQTGDITLDNLINISRVIDCLNDFNQLFINARWTDIKNNYEK